MLAPLCDSIGRPIKFGWQEKTFWEVSNVTKTIGMILLLVGVSGLALANGVGVPEIDPSSGASALALLSGALLVIRGRRNG